MKVLVFYVSFPKNLNDFEKNLNKLKKYLKIKKINDYDLCIVNNNPQILIKKKINRKEKIFNRNNSYFDFGAWNYLFQKKRQKISKYDWILLTNDTFDKDYRYHLKLFDSSKLETLIGRNVAFGHLDAYTNVNGFSKVSLNNKTSSYWLRTSFLFVNSSFFLKIKSLIFIKKNKIFKKNSNEVNRSNLKISDNYYDQINFWLFGINPEKKLSNNYRNQKKNSSNSYVKNKISAIANEFLLTRKLEDLGYKIFDIEWLYYNKNYNNPVEQIKYCAKKRLSLNITNP